MKFSFTTDDKSQRFCEGIVRAMHMLYDIPHDKAQALLNTAWEGIEFLGEMHLYYHETELYWARRLGNPNPYQDSTHPEQAAWKQRNDEAEKRLAEMARQYAEFWWNPPDHWPQSDSTST